MHWILTTTDTFSLRKTIKQSSWILHAPFRTTHTGDQLLRIERITSHKTVAVVIAQQNQSLVIHTSSNLTGIEIEELTKRARRILSLGENFKPFLNLIKTKPLPIKESIISPTILRGATLFEDVIRATALVWYPEGHFDAYRYSWLVEHFGDPLPSNPTLHAFPNPGQILQGQQTVRDKLNPAVGSAIIHVANVFESQAYKIGAMLNKRIPSLDLSDNLKQLLHLDDTPLSQVMLSLGRYDYVPTDRLARERLSRYWNLEIKPSPVDVLKHFESWQPWGGLAYWLWDWTPVTEPAASIKR